jgi:lipopolysaccharide/colanic/teichoic acid biosynthesis glycosyltransferase
MIPRSLSKRAVDLAFGVAAAPLLVLCGLLIAVIHRIFSPGPLFFLQERVGLQGRVFRIYKFRTMGCGAATQDHEAYFQHLIGSNAPMQKMDTRGDARLIPGGWLLRASGLDELPQLINVLRGEMSLVGPRPCLPAEFAAYLPEQRQRVGAVPGLTGLWQVSGKNRTTFAEMIQLDLAYVRTRSLGLDLSIILRTLPALARQILDTAGSRQATARPTAPPVARPIVIAAPAEALLTKVI